MSSGATSLAKGTTFMLLGFGGRVVLQTAAVVLIARTLGPSDFGRFASITALTVLLGPFVALGGYSQMVRHVRTLRGAARGWLGNAGLLIGLMTPVVLGVLFVLARLLLPDLQAGSLVLVAAADFLGFRVRMVAAGTLIAHDLQHVNAAFEILAGLLRLAAALAVVLLGAGLGLWIVLYAVGEVIAGFSAAAWTAHRFGVDKPALVPALRSIARGLMFAVADASTSAYRDLDKTMLPRFAAYEAAGIYTVAYRFIDVAYLPMNAFMSALYPRFFDASGAPARDAFRLARKVAGGTGLYGLAASATLFMLAPLISLVFGEGFAEGATALRWLAIVPFLQGLYWPFADALTGSGHQRLRTGAQVCALACNAGLNVVLIPAIGWRGAAVATAASESLLLVVLVSVAFTISRRGRSA